MFLSISSCTYFPGLNMSSSVKIWRIFSILDHKAENTVSILGKEGDMEEKNAMQSGVQALSETSILLTRFIETHADSLMRILRSYVRRANIASNEEEIQNFTVELLSEIYIQVTRTSAHFDPTRSPQAWLLGIAVNILREKKRESARIRQHEIPLNDLQRRNQDSGDSDEDALDRLTVLDGKGLEEDAEMRDEVQYLLSLVSEKDRYILELSYIHDLDGDALALELGCSYKAAQVRLWRARQRLRAALEKQEGERDE